MFVASPSASAANRIVFWSEGEVGIPKCEAPGEHASTSKLEDSKDGVVIHQRESIYVTLFEDMIRTVLKHEAKLFVMDELNCLSRYSALSYNARYLLIRLCLRKIEKWHRLSTLRYEQELGSGIPAAIQELCRDTPPELPSTEEQRPVVKEEEQPVVKEEEREIIDLTLDSPSHSQLAQSSQLSASTMKEPDYSYFADDDSQATLQELIDCLTLDELRGISKQMKLKITANRAQIVEALIMRSSTQTTLNFPVVVAKRNPGPPKLRQTTLNFPSAQGGKTWTTQQGRLRAIVMQTLGQCIRVNEDIVKLLRRLNLIYFRSTQYTPELLTPSILSRAHKRSYAPYSYHRTPDVWLSREALLAYEEALSLEAQVDGLFEGTTSHSRSRSHSAVGRTPASRGNVSVGLTPGRGNRDTTSPLKRKLESLKDEKEYVPDIEVSDSPRVQAARAVVEVVEWVFSRWQDLISIKDEHPRPNALQRFDCGHILTRVICKGAYALGILRDYVRELEVLEALLAQRQWRRGRRGRWHERRALILMTHMDKDQATYERAMAAVIEGLEDEDTHIIFRPMLERRLTRLENRLKIPKEERHICEGSLARPEIVRIEGVRVEHRAGNLVLDKNLKVVRKPPSFTQTSGLTQQPLPWTQGNVNVKVEPTTEKFTGKSIWVGRKEEEISVEMFALQHYEDLGFKGFHCEGRIVTTLFGLLFWDVIFAPVPGAFETPFQSAPLDIAEDTFYIARQEMADKRLEEIKNGEALKILARVLEEHSTKGTWCTGVRWDLFQTPNLLEIAECLGGDGLNVICRLLCEDYVGRCSGVPDLIVWNIDTKECKFVEVKGPGDSLQENQKVWIDVLVRAGVSVEVCHVDEEGKTKLKSGRNGKGKGKMIGKVVIKHEEDELESEEQINLRDASEMSTSIFPRTHPETDSPSKTRRRVEIVTPSPSHKRRRLESDPS